MADEPLSSASFTLTRADALAWEQARFVPSRLQIALFVVWLALCGSLVFLLPGEWFPSFAHWSLSAFVLIFAAMGAVIALLGLALVQWRAARRRLRRPVPLTITEWPGHLDIAGPDGPRTLPLAAIRQSVLTPTHLFLDTADETGAGLLILPRKAWDDPAALDALARRIASRPVAMVDAGTGPA
jgi:hypothetical protein